MPWEAPGGGLSEVRASSVAPVGVAGDVAIEAPVGVPEALSVEAAVGEDGRRHRLVASVFAVLRFALFASGRARELRWKAGEELREGWAPRDRRQVAKGGIFEGFGWNSGEGPRPKLKLFLAWVEVRVLGLELPEEI